MKQHAPDSAWAEISIVLVDDAGIHVLNQQFMERDEVTDVLSFDYAPLPGETDTPSAEIVVNVERARHVGPRYGGVERELALYIAHGCNHLTGADDSTIRDRERMRRRERRWLTAARENGLLEGLII